MITVPVMVVAQVWRGNNALVSKALEGCRIELHAIVVLGAVARGDVIPTSDRGDIERLLAAAGARDVLVLDI